MKDMTTYNIREFKAKISEIISTLEYDQEVIITRRGSRAAGSCRCNFPRRRSHSLQTLRGALTQLPDATYQDFVDIKGMWEPRVPPSDDTQHGRDG